MVLVIGVCAAVAGSCMWLWLREFSEERRKGRRAKAKVLEAFSSNGDGADDAERKAPLFARRKQAVEKLSIERHVPEMVMRSLWACGRDCRSKARSRCIARVSTTSWLLRAGARVGRGKAGWRRATRLCGALRTIWTCRR